MYKPNTICIIGVLCNIIPPERSKGSESPCVESLDCHVANIAFPSPLWVAPIKEIGDPPEAESRMKHDNGTTRLNLGLAENEGCPLDPLEVYLPTFY